MAIAVVLDFAGGTLDQYDQIIGKMHFTPGGPGAPGGLFHWVTQTDTGVRVTDVRDTREQFDDFARDQIGPISAEVGLPAPPEVTFHDVHSHLTAG
jgi:hypothetical protein